MKKLIPLISILFLTSIMFGQEEEAFSRKGRIFLETGTSIFSGFGSSTGGGILFNEGSTATQISFDGGKFISENFATKVRIGILGGSGSTITNFGLGGKYYIDGVAPFEIDLGIVSGFGNTEFLGSAYIGYAIKAASNIYFEPKAGVIYDSEEAVGSIKFAFTLIL